MSTNILYAGVDVSQDHLDVASCRLEHKPKPRYLKKWGNQTKQFDSLLEQLRSEMQRQHCERLVVVLEPTGGYEHRFAMWLIDMGVTVCMPNPKKVRDWAKGSGYRAKTDLVDARVLAHFGCEKKPPPWKPMELEYRELNRLLSWQASLEQLHRQTSNRLHSLKAQGVEAGPVLDSLQRTLAHLEQEQKAQQEATKKFVKRNEKLREQKNRLLTIPGVGEKVVLVLLVHLARFWAQTEGQGSHKKLVAYTGLDPQPWSSGTSVCKRSLLSKQGDKRVRCLLYLGAKGGVTSKQEGNPLVEFYNRLVGQGKRTKVARIAAARKILVWAWSVFRDNTRFDASLARSKKVQKELA